MASRDADGSHEESVGMGFDKTPATIPSTSDFPTTQHRHSARDGHRPDERGHGEYLRQTELGFDGWV
jgi:hypothetical protein